MISKLRTLALALAALAMPAAAETVSTHFDGAYGSFFHQNPSNGQGGGTIAAQLFGFDAGVTLQDFTFHYANNQGTGSVFKVEIVPFAVIGDYWHGTGSAIWSSGLLQLDDGPTGNSAEWKTRTIGLGDTIIPTAGTWGLLLTNWNIGYSGPSAGASLGYSLQGGPLLVPIDVGQDLASTIPGRWGTTYGMAYTLNYEAAASEAPEPESWALMIIGFGLVGTALRRRRGAAVSPA